MASILSITHNPLEIGEYKNFFGLDTDRVVDLCNDIFIGSTWGRYHDCYRSPDRDIALRQAKENWLEAGASKSTFIRHWGSAIQEWEEAHPEEVQQEELSKKRWRAKRRNTFDEIRCLGKRHHIFRVWKGHDDPGSWEIRRMTDNNLIGYISCD